MVSRRKVIAVAITGLITAATAARAWAKWASPVARFDTDKDNTVDLAEAKKAAGNLFDRLDTDKDGTLDVRELRQAEPQGLCGRRSGQGQDLEQGRIFRDCRAALQSCRRRQ